MRDGRDDARKASVRRLVGDTQRLGCRITSNCPQSLRCGRGVAGAFVVAAVRLRSMCRGGSAILHARSPLRRAARPLTTPTTSFRPPRTARCSQALPARLSPRLPISLPVIDSSQCARFTTTLATATAITLLATALVGSQEAQEIPACIVCSTMFQRHPSPIRPILTRRACGERMRISSVTVIVSDKEAYSSTPQRAWGSCARMPVRVRSVIQDQDLCPK